MTEEIQGEALVRYFERIERLQEEKKAISEDIRDIFIEAKIAGYDTKIMREMLRLRKMNETEREEREFLLTTYENALLSKQKK